MNTRLTRHLLHPVFVGGLLLLLLNDHYLKAAYGNWWTGKLSDLAGVVFLPLLWRAVFGGSARTAVLVTVAFFSWWKLPVSQPVIDGLNTLTGFGFGRVVDATDLLAFAGLPLSWWALRNISLGSTAPAAPPRYAGAFARLLLPVTAFALIATSAPDDDFFPDGTTNACCTDLPFRVQLAEGTIYLPTAFSPDFDGVNDVLQIIPDGGAVRVDTLRVYLPETDSLVFEATDLTTFAPQDGFDGTVNDTIEPRQFRVQVSTEIDGVNSRFNAFVCSLPCRRPSGVPEPVNLDNCVYGTQFVSGEGFRRELASLEDYSDCFD